MKILYHHRTQGVRVEGVHIRGVANALAALGHEVQIASVHGIAHAPLAEPTAAEPTAESLWRRALRWGAAHLPESLFELGALLFNLVNYIRLGWIIDRRRPDLIYERHAFFLFSTVLLARRRRIPIIVELNDSVAVDSLRQLRFVRLAASIERWTLRRATGLIFVSAHFRRLVEARHGPLAPSIVTHNGVAPDFIEQVASRRAATRARLGLGEDRVVCGFVGGFSKWHGVDGFAAALLPRMAEQPALVLLLVGAGETLPAVQRLVAEHRCEDRVLLPGRVPHGEVADWISAMDFSVLPNTNDFGSPMKIFEQAAGGAPVVGPDCPPVLELIRDGQDGWIFPRFDYGACAEIVLRVASRTQELAAVRERAVDRVRTRHLWSSNAEQLIAFYRERVECRSSQSTSL